MQVGVIGTGYAAKLRVQALKADPRVTAVGVAGHDRDRTADFAALHGAIASPDFQQLLAQPDLALVIVATANHHHGEMVQQALQAGKHVIVEYPLALDVATAEQLIALARQHQRLLHVEHIELLGGVHCALKAALPRIGKVLYARYVTLKPERPAPRRWTYHHHEFGFPLMGALSRLHRLVDLFGPVNRVTSQAQFWPIAGEPESSPYYASCVCSAQLQFHTGVLAEVTYGKGEAIWTAKRTFEVQGELGAIALDGEQGVLIQGDTPEPLAVGGRRGLFAKDTTAVLDHLLTGTPLYIQPEASLYTLKVAAAAQQAAQTGTAIAPDAL